MHRRGPLATAALFVVMAAMFSVVLWPDVSSAAKLAFFATGVGCGIGIGRMVRREG